MNTYLLVGLQSYMAVVFGSALLLVTALIWYALYRKGDVRAEFSHGNTVFKLEAKDRKGE